MNIDLSLFSSPILGTTEFLNKLPLKAGQLLVDIETKKVWYDRVSGDTVVRELFLPTSSQIGSDDEDADETIPTAEAVYTWVTNYVNTISGGLSTSAIPNTEITRLFTE